MYVAMCFLLFFLIFDFFVLTAAQLSAIARKIHGSSSFNTSIDDVDCDRSDDGTAESVASCVMGSEVSEEESEDVLSHRKKRRSRSTSTNAAVEMSNKKGKKTVAVLPLLATPINDSVSAAVAVKPPVVKGGKSSKAGKAEKTVRELQLLYRDSVQVSQ